MLRRFRPASGRWRLTSSWIPGVPLVPATSIRTASKVSPIRSQRYLANTFSRAFFPISSRRSLSPTSSLILSIRSRRSPALAISPSRPSPRGRRTRERGDDNRFPASHRLQDHQAKRLGVGGGKNQKVPQGIVGREVFLRFLRAGEHNPVSDSEVPTWALYRFSPYPPPTTMRDEVPVAIAAMASISRSRRLKGWRLPTNRATVFPQAVPLHQFGILGAWLEPFRVHSVGDLHNTLRWNDSDGPRAFDVRTAYCPDTEGSPKDPSPKERFIKPDRRPLEQGVSVHVHVVRKQVSLSTKEGGEPNVLPSPVKGVVEVDRVVPRNSPV